MFDIESADAEGVLRTVKKVLRAVFTTMITVREVPPPFGIHYYADKKAEAFIVEQPSDPDSIRRALNKNARRQGLIGSVYVSRGEHKNEACFVASVNLPGRGVTMVLPVKNGKGKGISSEEPYIVEDVELPGNLEYEGLAN